MAEGIILASTSATRQAMLRAAGVPFEAMAPGVDEAELKAGLLAASASPRDIADALAETKAVKISRRIPGVLVLGADQVLSQGPALYDKPENLAQARAHLAALRGKEHKLITAAVIALDGKAIWRAADTASLTMRPFSDAFLDAYLEQTGDAALSSVGCYQLEGLGAQLMSRVSGDHFTILGLPLLQVLDFLRVRGVLTP